MKETDLHFFIDCTNNYFDEMTKEKRTILIILSGLFLVSLLYVQKLEVARLVAERLRTGSGSGGERVVVRDRADIIELVRAQHGDLFDYETADAAPAAASKKRARAQSS